MTLNVQATVNSFNVQQKKLMTTYDLIVPATVNCFNVLRPCIVTDRNSDLFDEVAYPTSLSQVVVYNFT